MADTGGQKTAEDTKDDATGASEASQSSGAPHPRSTAPHVYEHKSPESLEYEALRWYQEVLQERENAGNGSAAAAAPAPTPGKLVKPVKIVHPEPPVPPELEEDKLKTEAKYKLGAMAHERTGDHIHFIKPMNVWLRYIRESRIYASTDEKIKKNLEYACQSFVGHVECLQEEKRTATTTAETAYNILVEKHWAEGNSLDCVPAQCLRKDIDMLFPKAKDANAKKSVDAMKLQLYRLIISDGVDLGQVADGLAAYNDVSALMAGFGISLLASFEPWPSDDTELVLSTRTMFYSVWSTVVICHLVALLISSIHDHYLRLFAAAGHPNASAYYLDTQRVLLQTWGHRLFRVGIVAGMFGTILILLNRVRDPNDLWVAILILVAGMVAGMFIWLLASFMAEDVALNEQEGRWTRRWPRLTQCLRRCICRRRQEPESIKPQQDDPSQHQKNNASTVEATENKGAGPLSDSKPILSTLSRSEHDVSTAAGSHSDPDKPQQDQPPQHQKGKVSTVEATEKKEPDPLSDSKPATEEPAESKQAASDDTPTGSIRCGWFPQDLHPKGIPDPKWSAGHCWDMLVVFGVVALFAYFCTGLARQERW